MKAFFFLFAAFLSGCLCDPLVVIQQLPNNGVVPTQNRASPGMASDNFALYMGFGYDECLAPCDQIFYNDLYKYNLFTQTWSLLSASSNSSSVPGPRTFAGFDVWSVGVTHTKVIVFGGLEFDSNDIPTNLYGDLWLFDTGSNAWTLLAGSTPLGLRFGTSLIVVGHMAYFFAGGSAATFQDFNDLWVCDLSASSLTFTQLVANNPTSTTQPAPRDRAVYAYSLLTNSFIFEGGDVIPIPGSEHPNDTSQYAISTNTFSKKASLSPRVDSIGGVLGSIFFVAYGDTEAGQICSAATGNNDTPVDQFWVNFNIFNPASPYVLTPHVGGPGPLKRPGYARAFGQFYFFGGFNFICDNATSAHLAYNHNLYQITLW
jgi:Galactose oxidase, central domain